MIDTRSRSRQLSSRMSKATLVLMIFVSLLLIAMLAAAILEPGILGRIMAERFSGKVIPVTTATALMLVLVIIAQASLFLWALDTLRRAFAGFAKADVLDADAALLLRRAGLLFAANAGAMILTQPLLSLVYSAAAPAGERFVNIQLGTGEMMSLLLSGILFVTGHLMALAAEVDGEMRQIV